MMAGVAASKLVHVFMLDQYGTRHWLVQAKTKRDEKTNRLVLWPDHSEKAEDSRPITFEFACIVRKRMWDEHNQKTYFTFNAGDTAEVIEETYYAVQK
jgi:hypothetical protein